MITLLVFAITIVVLVGVHEGGHFLAAKFSGVYVKEFAIGFGPKLVSFTHKETLYSLRVILFGGYVRLAGEAGIEEDEEIPTEALLYNQRPLHRIMIAFAGPAMNLLVTFVVAVIVLWMFGLPMLQVAGVIPEGSANGILEPGDRIMEIDDRHVYSSSQASKIIQSSEGTPINVLVDRQGREMSLSVTPEYDSKEGRYLVGVYFFPITYTTELLEVSVGSTLHTAGMRSGDEVVAVNGSSVDTYVQILSRIDEILPAESLTFTVLREDEHRTIKVTSVGSSISQIFTGARFADLGMDEHRPGVFKGIELGAGRFADYFGLMLHSLNGLLTGRIAASEAISGPIGIAQLLGKGVRQGPSVFLQLFSLLSLSLGLINLVPFPMLDGSRVAFALYEAVSGKPIPLQRQAMIHTIGAGLLILAMILITYQDILGLFR